THSASTRAPTSTTGRWEARHWYLGTIWPWKGPGTVLWYHADHADSTRSHEAQAPRGAARRAPQGVAGAHRGRRQPGHRSRRARRPARGRAGLRGRGRGGDGRGGDPAMLGPRARRARALAEPSRAEGERRDPGDPRAAPGAADRGALRAG